MVYLTMLETSHCIAWNPGNCTLFRSLLPENAVSDVLQNTAGRHTVRNGCGVQQKGNVGILSVKFDHSELPATEFEISTGYF
jgi:hypothetical protein